MSNEEYLILSYVIVAFLCLLVSAAVYFSLRRSFTALVSALPTWGLTTILKRTLFLGLVFPALLGFCTVSFKGCSVKTYDQVVEKRSYIVDKNQEQFSSSLHHLTYALFGWSFLVLGTLILMRKDVVTRREPDSAPVT
jgi:hypothetical protein